MKLRGKTALITGGAVRIGAAISRALAAEGCNLVVHYNRSRRAAEQLCCALRERVAALAIRSDLMSERQVGNLISAAVQRVGRLDILINNAAVFHKDSFRTLTAAKLEDEFFVNLFAPLLLMREFTRICKGGKIVNLLDRRITGLDASCVPYVLAKRALADATRMAALAFAPRITVNAVAPGAILPPPGKGREYLRDQAGPVPLRRQCTPAEVADAVVFLLKHDALTGQIVFVDGGQGLLGNE